MLILRLRMRYLSFLFSLMREWFRAFLRGQRALLDAYAAHWRSNREDETI